jgi:hypothetical protein
VIFTKNKKSTVKIDSIYSRHNPNNSDSESDDNVRDNNNDSSATIIDSDNAVIDSDNTVIEESDHGNEPEHMTIYPDISTITSTLQ